MLPPNNGGSSNFIKLNDIRSSSIETTKIKNTKQQQKGLIETKPPIPAWWLWQGINQEKV